MERMGKGYRTVRQPAANNWLVPGGARRWGRAARRAPGAWWQRPVRFTAIMTEYGVCGPGQAPDSDHGGARQPGSTQPAGQHRAAGG